MSDSDVSPKQDERNHCQSRSHSPVSPGYAGETLAERKERALAEAAVPVEPPGGRPWAAPADPEPPAQESVPAGEAAPAAQAAAPAAPPPEQAPGAQGAETAAPSTPPAQGTGPAWAPSA